MNEASAFSQSVEIIVVDDRRENLLSIEAVLTDPRYRITCLTSGEKLLQYLKNADTDGLAAILLDVQMPGMDGFETAALIKNRRTLQNIPIIFLTAINKTEAYMEKGYRSGAIDYIFKPVNPDILRHKIASFVRIHHYQRELMRANDLLRKKTEELEIYNRKLKEAEFQLSRANTELENKVEQRTDSLREAYQEIRQSHKLFRSVFSMSPALLAVRSIRTHKYLDVNDTWRSVTGYSLDEMNGILEEGLDMKWLDDEMDPPESVTNIRNAKVSFRTKSGEIRYGLLSKTPLELNGSTNQLIVIMDVTDQEQWEIHSARLERLHLIGEMAAAIAHEVRNPMTTIRGFLQLCKRNNDRLSEEYIDIMLGELERANNIITEFLTLAKNKTTDLKSLSLNDIVASLLPLLQAEAIIKGKQVLAEFGELPEQELDEKEIRQLILNIAMNGLDSMGEGGVLRIRTSSKDREIRLDIEDSGDGIPEEVMQKLGTPFFTTKEKGTGLGLAVCYSIASRHNASIDVDTGSEGTTFKVRFACKHN